MVTSDQLRAARALLNWTVRDLAEHAGVHRNTISRAETEATQFGYAIAQVVRTLQAAGIEFLSENSGGIGVRLGKPSAASSFRKPTGLATDAIERMEAEIAADQENER